MSKAIFLDIDGVLNAYNSKSRSPDGFIGVDDDKVALLKKIVDATGAIIILTSTWQKEFDPETGLSPSAKYLVKKLKKQHLTIFAFTRKWGWDRGEGIREFLNKYPEIHSWIALDDEIFPDFEKFGILPRLVQTNYYVDGLTEAHVETAINLLNGAIT